MNLKLVMAVSLCAGIPVVAYGQQNGPAANAPKRISKAATGSLAAYL
jgi:hypothetical protein